MNAFDFLNRINVINLDKYPERWQQAETEFKKYNITNYERFPGIIVNEGKTLQDRELGCSLSHKTIIRKARFENQPYVTIAEDDFVFDDRILNYIGNIDRFLKTNSWEMFYFGGNNLINPVPINGCVGRVFKTYTTHFYMINRMVYDIVLNENTNMPIDMVYSDLIQSRKNSLCCIPKLAYQRPNFSFIQDGFRDYTNVLKDN